MITQIKVRKFFNLVYFIISGRIFFVNEDIIPFKTMIIGSYFGEIEIIFKTKRFNTTVAAENSELLTLSKHNYENIIVKDYYEIHEEIKFIANLRNEKNREAEKILNQTLANNKERMKNKHLNEGKFKNRLIFRAYLDMKKLKREIQKKGLYKYKTDNLSIKSDINKTFNYVEKLLNHENLGVSDELKSKVSMISVIKSKKNLELKDVDRRNSMWSSEGEYSESEKTSGAEEIFKNKLSFYNKIISASKSNLNNRRQSFILNQIIMSKVGQEQDAIKEENEESQHSNKSDHSNDNQSDNDDKSDKIITDKYNKRKSSGLISLSRPKLNTLTKIKDSSLKRTFTINLSNQQKEGNNDNQIYTSNNSLAVVKSSSNNNNINDVVNNFIENQKNVITNLTKLVGDLSINLNNIKK